MEAARPLSDHFIGHAESEREKLAQRIEQLHEDAAKLRGDLETVQDEIDSLTSTLRDIEDLLGVSPQLRLGMSPVRVGGRELREIAVSILEEQGKYEPIHYTEWFEMVRSAGYEPNGNNPQASFLAQISQADSVIRVGRKSGLYRLANEASSTAPSDP